MDTTILQNLGLTQNEIKVYVALLEIGTTTSGAIIKKSGLYGTRVYDALHKLISKGFVSYFFSHNVKFFQASEPEILLERFNHQRSELVQLSTQLKNLSHSREGSIEPLVKVYEGVSGIKFAFNKLSKEFKKNKTLLVFGNPRLANQKLEPFFLEFHKERIKKQTFMKIIHNKNNRGYARKREEWKYTHVRYMPRSLITPSWINIFQEKVLIFNIEDKPFVIEIYNPKVAASYSTYFNLLWAVSKK